MLIRLEVRKRYFLVVRQSHHPNVDGVYRGRGRRLHVALSMAVGEQRQLFRHGCCYSRWELAALFLELAVKCGARAGVVGLRLPSYEVEVIHISFHTAQNGAFWDVLDQN